MFDGLPDYPAHDRFIAPARPRGELWRTALGAALILAVYVLSMQGLLAAYVHRFGRFIGEILFRRMTAGLEPQTLVILLFSFLGMAAGPVIAARFLHGRPGRTLVGPSLARAAGDFFRVGGVLILASLVLLPLGLDGAERNPALSFGSFLGWLPLALVAIAVQTGAEELVFRGYLQQQLAARFSSPLVWLLAPAALFACGHYDPAVWGPNTAAVLGWTAMFGVLAGDLTARTGSLGAAMGFHFANNVSAMLLLALKGQMDGLALWVVTVEPGAAEAQILMLVDLAALIVAWLLARLVLRV